MKPITIAAAAIAVATLGVAHANGSQSATHAHHGAVKNVQKPWGIAGDAKTARRTIEIAMLDEMRFAPSVIEVAQGDTVRFVMRNTGKLMHELVIGTKKSLDEHAASMLKSPEMAHGGPGMTHGEPGMAHVAPGATGEFVWTFNRPGRFDFACLIPGHYQSGMRGTITVATRSPGGGAAK